MKYQIGDVVLIREDLEFDRQYAASDGTNRWFPECDPRVLGREGVIVNTGVHNGTLYAVEVDGVNEMWFVDSMFVGLSHNYDPVNQEGLMDFVCA